MVQSSLKSVKTLGLSWYSGGFLPDVDDDTVESVTMRELYNPTRWFKPLASRLKYGTPDET